MDKREKEMHTVYEMIHLYCRKKHKEKELCPECLDLYEYAKMHENPESFHNKCCIE